MGSSPPSNPTPERGERARADLAACRDRLRAGSKSFFAASLLLPAWMRARTVPVYAFCRIADDMVDDTEESARLATLERRLDAVYAGRPWEHPVDRALTRVVEATSLPRPLFDALLEGFAWDVAGRPYETFSGVLAYGARVAGTVGVIMSVLMERRARDTLARAADLGVAMQLTNIARDVGEDARRGRLYLPGEWLNAAGVDARALLTKPTPSPALAAVVARLLGEAERLYARGLEGIPSLPWDCRVAIAAAGRIYADIGRVIAARGLDSVTTRASTSTARKLWLVMRSLPAIRRGEPGPATPPLAETRFLVDAAVGVGDAPAWIT